MSATPQRPAPTALDLLLDELRRSCNLSDWQERELRRVFGRRQGERIHVCRLDVDRDVRLADALLRQLPTRAEAVAALKVRLRCGKTKAYRLASAALAARGAASVSDGQPA